MKRGLYTLQDRVVSEVTLINVDFTNEIVNNGFLADIVDKIVNYFNEDYKSSAEMLGHGIQKCSLIPNKSIWEIYVSLPYCDGTPRVVHYWVV